MLGTLLRRWFYDNALLKLVALVLAVTLFILVSGEKETERTVRVGVAYVRPTDRVLVSDVPDSLEVTVRGSWTRIKRLDPADVDAIVIDLTKRGDGEIAIDEDDIRIPAGLRVVSIRPAKLMVQFEHMKRVPVVPELVGASAEGYVVERVVADPVAIAVRGPARVVDSITDARTLPVSVSGKRGPFRSSIALAPLPGGAVAEVDNVAVEVIIVEEVSTRTVQALPVTLRPPVGAQRAGTPPGLRVEPQTVNLVLRGGRAAMKQVAERAITASVELHIQDYSLGSSRQAPVLVSGVPAGVAVEVHPREITLSMPAPGGANEP